MRNLKKQLLLGVSATALIGGAQAADLRPAFKAQPAAAIAVFSWTGCSVGVHAGYGRGRNKYTQQEGQGLSEAFSGGIAPPQDAPTFGGVDTTGGIFGGQIGCDYQFAGSPFVLGIQGSLAHTTMQGLGNDSQHELNEDPVNNAVGVRTKWLGSITGRLGYAPWNQALIYVKGGAAWQESQFDFRSTVLNFGTGVVDKTFNGWTVGGGIEWVVWQNWTAFAEYNHYQFQEATVISAVGDPGDGPNVFRNRPSIDEVKVGVNYRFWGWH